MVEDVAICCFENEDAATSAADALRRLFDEDQPMGGRVPVAFEVVPEGRTWNVRFSSDGPFTDAQDAYRFLTATLARAYVEKVAG